MRWPAIAFHPDRPGFGFGPIGLTHSLYGLLAGTFRANLGTGDPYFRTEPVAIWCSWRGITTSLAKQGNATRIRYPERPSGPTGSVNVQKFALCELVHRRRHWSGHTLDHHRPTIRFHAVTESTRSCCGVCVVSWDQRFDWPVVLPDGKRLRTLDDARRHILTLPKSEHETTAWQVAIEALLLAAEAPSVKQPTDQNRPVPSGTISNSATFSAQTKPARSIEP